MKKGFTLIELLAVIIVLALILLIAVPMILGVIEKAKKGAIESDAKLIIDAIEKRKAMDDMFSYLDITEDNIEEKLGIKPINYKSLEIKEIDGKPIIIIEGQNKYDGYTAYGPKENINVVKSEDYDVIPPVITLLGDNPLELEQGDTYIDPGATANDNKDGNITDKIIKTGTVNTAVAGSYTITYTVKDALDNTTTKTRTVNVLLPSYAGPKYRPSKGVNGPVLAKGMVPIKWNGTKWIDTDIYDSDWYNYTITDKKWANARTSDCTNTSDPSTCSMWVWIPRYAYQIASNYHTGTAGTINIKFLKDTTNTASDDSTVATIPTYVGSSQTNYIQHPTFNFGGKQITGIWVAKFEASGTSDTIASKPNALSFLDITIGNMFTYVRNMETLSRYGWNLASGTLNADGTFSADNNGVDTHLMKNVEWGAVAYLSRSSYGINGEVGINNYNGYMTGCGAAAGSGASGVCNVYSSATGMLASTTGTLYGIYDISGGAWEYVMGNLMGYAVGSGLTPTSINDKYIDRYDTYSNAKYGDAVYETSAGTSGQYSWYSDNSVMVSAGNPWFLRGGVFVSGNACGAFHFSLNTGGNAPSYGFRPTLIVGPGL